MDKSLQSSWRQLSRSVHCQMALAASRQAAVYPVLMLTHDTLSTSPCHTVQRMACCNLQVVVRDGIIDRSASRLDSLPAGVFIGPVSQAPTDAAPAQLVR